MKIFLTNQQSRLKTFLPEYRSRQLSYDEHTVLREKRTTVVVRHGVTAPDLSAYDFSALYSYEIFPKNIMSFAAEWQEQGRAMRAGDVIVQQACLPPFFLSIKCVFGVQVQQIFSEPARVGFSYGTLIGHAEMGISEFYFSLQDGVLRATIHTFSYPGTLLTRLVAPLITLPYQQYCTNLALRRMRAGFLQANRSGSPASLSSDARLSLH